MGRTIAILMFLGLMGCQNKVSRADLALLAGYWEIEKVTLPNGQTRNYTVNTTIDYIEIQDLSGFRKKVYPKLNGTYDTSNDAEKFTIVEKAEGFEIHYKNNLSKWTEKIRAIDNESLIVANEEGIVYQYKRYEPINIGG